MTREQWVSAICGLIFTIVAAVSLIPLERLAEALWRVFL